MGRTKKDAKVLNVKLNRLIYDRFERYADQLGQTKTTALERILQKHLDDFEQCEEEERKLLSYGVSLGQVVEKADMKPEDLHSWEDVEIDQSPS